MTAIQALCVRRSKPTTSVLHSTFSRSDSSDAYLARS